MISWIESDLSHFISQIVIFLQHLLDATFLSLVQFRPSHPLLTRISQLLAMHAYTIDTYSRLSSSLEPFSKAHRYSLEGHQAKYASRNDLKRQKKVEIEQADAAIGMYRLEELNL